MVGVPRSTGCATCVSRRIKCDEGKPQCQKCVKSGRSCPGYNRPLIFKNSTAADPKRKRKDVSSSSSSAGSSSPSDARRDSLMVQVVPQKPRVNSMHAPQTEQLQAMSALIDGFAPPTPTPTVGSFLRDWLAKVYFHIGNAKSLDSAMRSVACLQFGMKNKDSRTINYSRSYYVSALQSLQRALVDPSASHGELQSAVMLLTFYELMSNRKEDEWIRHAGGSTELMRLRGPRAYADRKSFDHTMYMVCRYYIVMESFYKRKACFLDDPEWNTLAHDPDSVEGNIRESMFRIHVQIPGLLRDAHSAAAGQYSPIELVKRTIHLRTTVLALYEEWMVALADSGDMPIEIPGDDDMFPTVYHFYNLSVHGFMSQHCSTVILLDTILIDAGLPSKEDMFIERQTLAYELCKLTQFGANRVMGSILMHFWLITAEKYADPKYRDWVTKKRASMQGPSAPPSSAKAPIIKEKAAATT